MSEYILEIEDKDLGLEDVVVDEYDFREASRAVIFNKDNEIAFLNVGKHGYHKLPGGGIEVGETWEQAILREAEEEVGASIKIREGFRVKILEYRKKWSLKHISNCCIADLSNDDLADLNLDDYEVDFKQLPIWVTIDKAIELIKNDKPDDYMGKFIVKRDLAFLNAVKEFLELGNTNRE